MIIDPTAQPQTLSDMLYPVDFPAVSESAAPGEGGPPTPLICVLTRIPSVRRGGGGRDVAKLRPGLCTVAGKFDFVVFLRLNK